MKRPEAHIIGDEAEPIFRKSIPRGWVCRKCDPDYAIDFEVEVVDRGVLTGKRFGVQLKGRSNLRADKDISQPIDVQNLLYYRDKYPAPVFLVVTDLRDGKAYWRLIDAAVEQLKDDWSTRKKVSIRLRREETILDETALRALIDQANDDKTYSNQFSRARYLEAQKRALGPAAKGWELSQTLGPDGTVVQFAASEPRVLKFRLTSERKRLESKLDELFGKGLPTEFEAGEFTIQGSPLDDKIAGSAVTLQVERKLDAELIVERADVGTEVYRAQGHFIGGASRSEFVQRAPDSPIRVKLVVDTSSRTDPISFSVRAELSAWIGRPLCALPYADHVRGMYESICDGAELAVKVRRAGVTTDIGRATVELAQATAPIDRLLEAFEDAAYVARRYGCPKTLERLPGPKDAFNCHLLRRLLEAGSITIADQPVRLEALVGFRDGCDDELSARRWLSEDCVDVVMPINMLEVLGKHVFPFFGPLHFTFRNACGELLNSRKLSDGRSAHRIRFAIRLGSSVTIRQPRQLPRPSA